MQEPENHSVFPPNYKIDIAILNVIVLDIDMMI